ncbi:Disks large homolog 5, partial [Lemmus lemmus]
MSALKRLEGKNTEASEQLSELTKETVLYGGLHSWLLMQHSQLEQKVDLLRQEKKKLWGDWVLLMQHVEDLKVLCKSQEDEDSDVRTHQQQELKGLVERLQCLLKQKETDTQEKDLAEKLQHHFEFSQMRSKTLQPEVEEATAQDESHLQKELLQEEPPAEPHPQQL